MKNTLTLLIILAFSITCLISCKKEAEIVDIGITSSFIYAVNGVQENATSVKGESAGLPFPILLLMGENIKYRAYINIDSNLNVGNYALDANSIEASFTLDLMNAAVRYQMVGGRLNLTAHDKILKHLEGTFNGKCYNSLGMPTDSIQISNGSFKINY